MRRLKNFLALFIFSMIISSVNGQEVLMTVEDREITLDEFERIYKKNNNSITNNQQTPEEYLDLFINFKLKVIEAENLGMDTTKKFLNEFNGYKEQLAKPYMTDEETKQFLMKEAYDRMHSDVHVSHILLVMDNQSSPEDTLKRYEMAMAVRQRILDGEPFDKVAKATSDDPGAKINGGDLGFFTVFMMLYQFESAAYKLDDSELSMPVRTMHGYHIIKKHETRPAVGQVKVAHVFVRVPEKSSTDDKIKAKSKITAISDSLKMGIDFASLAKKYSDDRNSAVEGGELPWFGTGRMIKEFEQKAFNMNEPGSITKPFRSFYGWHIVKLIDKKGIGTYEEMESTLQTKALKGDRDRVKRKKYLDKLKEKYEYTLNEDLYKRIYSLVDTSIFLGEWDAYRNTERFDENLFTTTEGAINLSAFIEQLDSEQKRRTEIPVENYVDIVFNKYLEDYMLNVEKSTLPQRFPEYKYILQEYHDGILLFDLMDEKVWTNAVKDTSGLETYFADHRSEYMWGDRMKAIIVSADSSANVEGMYKKASKIAEGKWKREKLNKKFCTDIVDCIYLEYVLVESGRNLQIDALNSTIGVGDVYNEGGKFKFVITTKVVPPTEKELDETRGQATSDYQDYLEKRWIETLREKYKVSVNNELLSKIKN
jgi:peptidyl-prolyl cis-trans isomerase SurA